MPYGRPTRAEILRYAIAFALGNVKFRDKKLGKFGLLDAERLQIADDTIAQLRKHGAWADLDEPVDVPVGLTGPAKPR